MTKLPVFVTTNVVCDGNAWDDAQFSQCPPQHQPSVNLFSQKLFLNSGYLSIRFLGEEMRQYEGKDGKNINLFSEVPNKLTLEL